MVPPAYFIFTKKPNKNVCVFEKILHIEECTPQEMPLVHRNLHKVARQKVVLGLF
jgi:hypothetical protein